MFNSLEVHSPKLTVVPSPPEVDGDEHNAPTPVDWESSTTVEQRLRWYLAAVIPPPAPLSRQPG